MLMFLHRQTFNPLECKGDYSAISNNKKSVHWPLTGGLLHLIQRGGNWRSLGPLRPLLAVPNVTLFKDYLLTFLIHVTLYAMLLNEYGCHPSPYSCIIYTSLFARKAAATSEKSTKHTTKTNKQKRERKKLRSNRAG